MKFGPSMQQAYKRRHWLLATSIAENILFSAVLLGWPAMVSVLKNEGYYASLCTDNNGLKPTPQDDVSSLSSGNNLSKLKYQEVLIPLSQISPLAADLNNRPGGSSSNNNEGCCPEVNSCPAQEKKLNLCFTVGSFLLSALTLPICVASDKIGARWLRIVGGFTMCVSAILFACSSSVSPSLLFFACALNGIGGNVIAFTSLQVANLFGKSRTSTLGLLVGSYAAAAIVFPTMKVLYALGASVQLLFISMAIATLGVVVNAWVNLPTEPIPHGLDLTRLAEDVAASSNNGRTESNKVQGLEELAREAQTPQSDFVMRTVEPSDDIVVMGLHRVVFMPMYMWSVLVISVTQLRLLFFVGDLHQLLVQMTHDNPETVDLYIFIFGILQICCLGTTHFIGGFVDWRSKKNNLTDEDTHLLSRPANNAQPTRTTKPIPPSSTTTSFLAEKAEASETVPPTPMSALSHSETAATHLQPPTATPVAASVPATPDIIGTTQGHAETCITSSNSETFFNVRKTSLVHLVSNGPEAGAKRVSLVTGNVVSTPERRPVSRQGTASTAANSSKDLERKIQRIKDCAIVLFVTSTLTVIFGLLVLIPALTIQISTFVCYTLIRGFVPCVIGRLYCIAFHPVHHQTLIGLTFLLSALFSVVQHPLFAIVSDYCDGDPYWVNTGLLVLSLASFGLPIHLLLHCAHLEEWRKATAGPPQPVLIKMQYLDTKLTGRGNPADL